MKVRWMGVRCGVTILALGASLLAIPTSLAAQRADGIARVGWLEVCGPASRRPTSTFSGLASRNSATWRGRISSSSSDSRIADTT
jgi:hypothetical protein